MRAARLRFLLLTLAASACGGGLATSPSSDGGSHATGSGTTETAETTDTYTSVTTVTVIGTGTATGTATGTDAASCMIEATNYDVSCSADSDCVDVTTGNFCVAGCECGGSTISAAALPQYNADIANTPRGSGLACPCPATPNPCCRQGQCTTQCAAAASDTLPPCAMAGGTCEYIPMNGIVSASCPAQLVESTSAALCAYADEDCCVSAPLP